MALEYTVQEVFSEEFVLTRNTGDPRWVDYTLMTHEVRYINPDRTISQALYYMDYDPQSQTFSNLAVQVNYTYTYDNSVLVQEQREITWFFDGQVPGTTFLKYIVYH